MLFNSAIFCKLAVLKKHSLRLVFLEHFVLRKPALRQYFFRCTTFKLNHLKIFKMKKLLTLLVFVLIAISTVACLRESEEKDKISIVTATVHHQHADLKVPPFFDTVVKGLRIKESGSAEWITITGIQGFTYEEGFEYELRLQKTHLADPPQDSPSDVTYKLLETLSKKQK